MNAEREFIIRPMTHTDASQIAQWQYDGIYAFYDFTADPDDLHELLTPKNWGSQYYSIDDGSGSLVGFFQFIQDGDTIDIGVGLRPTMTGKGLGVRVVQTGLAFAERHFAPRQFRLAVASFNTRAIRVYEHVGFHMARTYKQATDGGLYEYVKMVRAA